MRKMLVTLTIQTEVEYDELDDGTYEEELERIILDLEDMGLTVSVESEESVDDEDEDDF